ncbi:hypothetical protein E1B28_000267 [Marasmius oreades]|uniref:LysM domain-containing protein n=1 Tax=Marasmius oreades TaxID=181124 RepID=A0A9P8ADY6_9AGAR|nr:uncharacterized protein E1B28_000267 [Marasmius oreades]KAG7098306.1 hypothetical protein E1B28_000267 [Marasmius oreades]
MPDGLANPFFNPFSDNISQEGVFDNTEATPTYRTLKKRSSYDSIIASSSSSSNKGHSVFTGSILHSRARTDVQAGIPSSSHHPLRGAGISNGATDSGVTRPHLSRVLTSQLIDFEEEQREEYDLGDIDAEAAEEKAVLVHKVAHYDSLAGVALKYGINISELRRANHLWASDSIHLRKELYIPLDKVSRPQVAHGPFKGVSPQASGSSPSTTVFSGAVLVDDSSPIDHPTGYIRKIPAKQLSFFPPSAKPPKTAQDGALSLGISDESKHNARIAGTNTPPTSLNAILNALPIAASTRDSIMARLSFESATSSYNDGEHELVDVRVARHARSMSHDGIVDDYNSTTKAQKAPHPRVLKKNHGRPVGSSDINLRNFSRQDVPTYPMTSPNTMFSSSDITSFPVPVRTVQMEPSPTMHLPSSVRLSKTLGGSNVDMRREKRRPLLIDVEFDSNGGNSPSD